MPVKSSVLHVDVFGDGPDLVLLHGWGMHSGVMTPWARELASSFRVSAVDLPGHGDSPGANLTELGDWADAVLDVVPGGAWWLGWSLGGLVALEAAQRKPDHLRGALLMASTPKFVTGPDWQVAVDAQVFDQFARQLQEDVSRTLLRFVALQVRGADHSGQTLRELRAALKASPQAKPEALRNGLGFLRNSDMRHMLYDASLPLFWVLGERDTLVPARLSASLPRNRSRLISGAGHAPFLSHPQECAEQIRQWLTGSDECSEYAAS